MAEEQKMIADVALRLIDTVIKLSTALLVVPMAFLRFVSDMDAKSHPGVLEGVHAVSIVIKMGIFIPFGLSIGLGLCTYYAVIRAGQKDLLTKETILPKHINYLILVSLLSFGIGVCFLIYLFSQFPIEILGPFRIGQSKLG